MSPIRRLQTDISNKIIDVYSPSDLPTPVGGVITFKAEHNQTMFLFNDDILISDRIVIEDGIIIQFRSVNLHALVYTGTGTMFTASNFGLLIFIETTILAPSGTLWSLSGSGQVIGISAQFAGAAVGGTATNDFLTFLFVSFFNFKQGFIYNNNRLGIAFSEGSFIDWQNETTTMLTFTGESMGDIAMFDTGLRLASNETMFDFDQSLRVGKTRISITTNTIDQASVGALLAPDSLDQAYVGSIFVGNTGIPNSTSVVKLVLINNTATTTITTQGANIPINTNVLYQIDALIERFLIQDICTFDNTINRINTTFNHGFAYLTTFDNTLDTLNTIPAHNRKEDDVVFLFTVSGALPTGLDNTTKYFVLNPDPVLNTFQLSLTKGGSVVNFTTNGSGTLFYRLDSPIAAIVDTIFLNTYTGTLPAELDNIAEYFIMNPTEFDFQISLTKGGPAINFTDDGSGTLFYRHNTGVTLLAQVIYIGNESIKCRASGWNTIESVTGSKISVRTTIMQIDIDGTITEDQVGAPIAVTNTESGVSVLSNVATLSQGQGNIIYTRNDTNTTNIVVTDSLINYNDVS